MRCLMLPLVCVAVTGCATMADDEPLAARQECKSVAVYSGAEAIRHDVHGTAREDALAQDEGTKRAEGAMAVSRTRLENPRELRAPPGSGLMNDLARRC